MIVFRRQTWVFQILCALYLPFNIFNAIFNLLADYCWGVLQLTINISLFYLYGYTCIKLDLINSLHVLTFQDLIINTIFFLHEALKNVVYLYYRHNTKQLLESIHDTSLILNGNYSNSNVDKYAIIEYCIIGISMCYDFYMMASLVGWFGIYFLLSFELNSLLLQIEIHAICKILLIIKQNLIEINKKVFCIYNINSKFRNSIKIDRVMSIIEFYKKVCTTAKEANRIFQCSVLTIVFVCVSSISTYTYTFLAYVMPNNEEGKLEVYRNLTPATIRIIICCINILIIIKSFVSISDEAKKTATLIHNIWNKHGNKILIDSDLNHLQLISLQLLNGELNFTAHGFFPLDWTLLYSIIGAITSYVVILVQFEMESHKS